jgi:antitoxin component YwqK of YwqJK toxin-antitoxin module
MQNHYQNLGLQEGASQEAIQEAYDRLYKELNPANNDHQDFFIEEFEKLQEAYKVLRNSSILSVTSENVEESTLSTSSSAIKKPVTKLKPQKALNQSKVKTTKFIIVAIAMMVSVLIAYMLFQPKQYELSQITLVNDAAYSAFTRADMKPFTGNVKGVGTFINGLAEGEHNKLDKNGNIIATGHYKNGKKIGFWKEWYTIKDGEWHFWYEKGVPKKECNYNSGKLEGEFSSWFANGQLENVGNYKNGEIKGEWRYYDKNGKLLAHFNYDGEIWADKNLDVSRYRNGDLIPEVKDPQEWKNLTTGAWCYYNNDPKYGAIYGKLYNWYAVNDPRGLAPNGYHIPSYTEMTIGKFLKSSDGFKGLLGGARYFFGAEFLDIGIQGSWWSSSEVNNLALYCNYYYRTGKVDYDWLTTKKKGYSVRCLRDISP